jgi:hypothetical protein
MMMIILPIGKMRSVVSHNVVEEVSTTPSRKTPSTRRGIGCLRRRGKLVIMMMKMRTEREQVFSTKDGVLKQNLASKQTTTTTNTVLRFRTRNRRRWKGKDERKSE